MYVWCIVLHLCCLGGGPEGYDRRPCEDFWAALHKLVFLVMAWFRASSHLYYLLTIYVCQSHVNLFKLSDLFPTFAHSSILLTPLVPRKSAADFFWKFLLEAPSETVGWIFFARSSIKETENQLISYVLPTTQSQTRTRRTHEMLDNICCPRRRLTYVVSVT